MRLLIASDIHGSAKYCGELLDAFDREGADRLVLLGDILYHGPRNDLPEGYAPKAVAEMLNARREVILCVRGNCEAEVDQMVLSFPVLSDSALILLEARTIFCVHGHRQGPEDMPPLKTGDILLSGHTHVPARRVVGGALCLNPGSVSIPKGGSPRGYMLLADGAFAWKTLSGEEYARQGLSNAPENVTELRF